MITQQMGEKCGIAPDNKRRRRPFPHVEVSLGTVLAWLTSLMPGILADPSPWGETAIFVALYLWMVYRLASKLTNRGACRAINTAMAGWEGRTVTSIIVTLGGISAYLLHFTHWGQ